MVEISAQEVAGRLRFVADHMPILRRIRERLVEQQPFAGLSLAIRIHVEPKTGVLIRALRDGGAEVLVMGNKGTTDDALAGLLRSEGIEILGARQDDDATIGRHLSAMAAGRPDLVLDNGAELIGLLAASDAPPRGATEETTSGAFALRGPLKGKVPFPVIVINDSPLKAIVENKHGVGQSVIESVRLASNVMLHRRKLVVVGYGWCGRGIAQYGRAAGADVAVVEIDAIKALEAAIDGFEVLTLDEAVEVGDLFITATGRPGVVSVEHIMRMRDNAVLANAGHFDTEIDVAGMRLAALRQENRGRDITRFVRSDGTGVDVVAQGTMVNLAVEGSRGNSVEIMDLGFSLQALSLERLALDAGSLSSGDQAVPDDIDVFVAREMVKAMRSA